MASEHFELATDLAVSAEEAWNWHDRPGALQRLVPPWEPVRVLEQRGDLSAGLVTLEVPIGPIHQRWVSRHRDAVVGRQFVDEQIEGPFDRWVHSHLFDPIGAAGCRYTDRIDFELPRGLVARFGAGFVRRRLTRTFCYRHDTLSGDLAAHHRHTARGPFTILVTGANGMLGRTLIPFLTTGGHRVRRLVRRAGQPDDLLWDPAAGRLNPALLEGLDAVVHFAGEPIAAGRWTPAARERILQSRIQGTTLLAETLAGLRRPPRVLVSASAVGVYGDRGDEVLTEDAHLRTGPEAFFVERVGHAWEAATAAAERAGIRVVRARIGIVLTPEGGALARMLPPFAAGVGGRLGDGTQYMSWIGIDDVLGAIHHAIMTESLKGPVNVTAPEPVTSRAFASVLGEVLNRPALLPVPATALRLALGDMADELLLASARVVPERLRATGYEFRHPTLAPALRHVLGR